MAEMGFYWGDIYIYFTSQNKNRPLLVTGLLGAHSLTHERHPGRMNGWFTYSHHPWKEGKMIQAKPPWFCSGR